jgi:hypothetical protein
MKSPFSSRAGLRRFWRVLLLSGIILLAGGCATMSRPTLGIGGTDDNLPRVGR